MRRGVDTNVLVYAHIASFPEHPQAKGRLEAFLAEADSVLVIAPIALHELVQIITDARRFYEPVSMAEAIELLRVYRRLYSAAVRDLEGMELTDRFLEFAPRPFV